MKGKHLRVWAWVHKWSSLVCTVFMLLLCLTGLPLIFHHELGHVLGTELEAPALPAGMAAHARIPLDEAVHMARQRHPGWVAQFASPDEEEGHLWRVMMAPTPAPTDNFKLVVVDARTGRFVGEPPLNSGFLWVMRKLHVDLYAGIPGKLFLGFMGLLLLVSLVSGVVLYGPFMKKLSFGTVRRGGRQARLKWLDLHNLLGIATLVWCFVVGATGVVNTLSDVLVGHWQRNSLGPVMAPYRGLPAVPVSERVPVQQALDAVQRHVPDTRLYFMAFPGTAFSSPHHYTFFMRGNTPLTSQLPRPVLVDARTAHITAAPRVPWYLTALLLSRPLHFGDYGGLAMQLLWAALDVIAILVLGSGLYLWLKKARGGAHSGQVAA